MPVRGIRGATCAQADTRGDILEVTRELVGEILRTNSIVDFDEIVSILFTTTPDLTAYTNLGPQVDLEAKNPAQGAGEAASAKLDFSGPDRADPDALNAILWHALKPGVPMPAPVRSAQH